MQNCLTYICRIKSDICVNWREKIIFLSLSSINLNETAIQNLSFFFYKKTDHSNVSTLFEIIKNFDETTSITFVKNFRLLVCSMYGKTIIQNNKVTFKEELSCIQCDQNTTQQLLKTSFIDDTRHKNLNEYWKNLLVLYVNSTNTVIRCEVIKNVPLMVNHFYPDSTFRNQMLKLINDEDEEVRIQCSKVLKFIILEKDSLGNIQLIKSYFSQLLNNLCSTVNTSLKYGNNELQYTCLETIFNVGW